MPYFGTKSLLKHFRMLWLDLDFNWPCFGAFLKVLKTVTETIKYTSGLPVISMASLQGHYVNYWVTSNNTATLVK